MKSIRLFLPGEFDDAQLYMGHLLLFTADRDVRAVELEPLTSRLETRYSEWRGLLTLAFARNDWLGSGAMTAIGRNALVAEALNMGFERMAGKVLELDDADFEALHLEGFRQEASAILDSVLYGARMYLGTTEGLYHYDIDWDALTVSSDAKRTDARCVRATAEYGAINASCEADGLLTGYDEFGWRDRNEREDLVETASYSVRSAFLGTDLVNYETPVEPELLRASVADVELDGQELRQAKRKVVTGFSRPEADARGVVTQLEEQRSVPKDDVQFVWNSSRAFFLNTFSHGFFTATRTSTNASGITFRRHGRAHGRVVAVHPFPKGWVVETDFRLYVLSSGKLIELLDREPMSVRTFEGSKRYRRLVAATVESGVYLISAVADF
ncbi:MAG: hypothetical protein JHD16_03560 [Solirubrobacteraceae bacterium]|nr:hypothetical protein [Solirubrobacteraceae bacterium]